MAKVAAIYARKSTDDSDRNDEARSTTRQAEHARAFALRRGWTVVNEHVYLGESAVLRIALRRCPDNRQAGFPLEKRAEGDHEVRRLAGRASTSCRSRPRSASPFPPDRRGGDSYSP